MCTAERAVKRHFFFFAELGYPEIGAGSGSKYTVFSFYYL